MGQPWRLVAIRRTGARAGRIYAPGVRTGVAGATACSGPAASFAAISLSVLSIPASASFAIFRNDPPRNGWTSPSRPPSRMSAV